MGGPFVAATDGFGRQFSGGKSRKSLKYLSNHVVASRPSWRYDQTAQAPASLQQLRDLGVVDRG